MTFSDSRRRARASTREVAKYPADQKQSAVMACLAIVQQEQGFVSARAPRTAIADYLGMPPIAVHEVTTFYNMYNQQPVGKFKLNVCTNLPCQLRDGQKALAAPGAASWASSMGEHHAPTACSRCSRASAWAPAPTRR